MIYKEKQYPLTWARLGQISAQEINISYKMILFGSKCLIMPKKYKYGKQHMLITPNNNYIEIQYVLENAKIYFNEKVSQFFGTESSLGIELKKIFNDQLGDLDEINFK